MHVRVRLFGKPEVIVVVDSKLTKIDKFRSILKDKFDIAPKLQRLFYGGKLLEDGYTFHDYNIKLNDVIQLMVRVQPQDSTDKNKTEVKAKSDKTKQTDNKKEYKDAVSSLYAVGDLIDMKDKELGAWFEAKILRIVENPETINKSENHISEEMSSDKAYNEPGELDDSKSDIENKPSISNKENSKSKNGIAKYFSVSPKPKSANTKVPKKLTERNSLVNAGERKQTEEVKQDPLFKVLLDEEEESEDSDLYCKLNEIRPRARTVIDVEDLKVGQTVMLNHNTDDPHEKGYWYDFKVSEIKKFGRYYDLTGTLYLGSEGVPQHTTLRVHDKIYAIEDVVPLAQRSDEYKKIMVTPTEKRSQPLNCLKCRDVESKKCKECGCYTCAGKENPEKIILCDECNKGFHMFCLNPPMVELPDEDWYCPSCKRDTNDVIAPGAAKQTKKAATTKRDWGRGMACVGKTKTCAMPANHFGPIPGIEVGMCWRYRIQLSESGVHRPPVSGIHGRDVEGAYSIVLSGGYEDDYDNGVEFTYTGSGGRDLSGNKRTAEQSCDQKLTRENKALARNCAVKLISEAGGDAGDDWRQGKPVRVVRSYKMLKHFPKYAPKEGIRYDGIYKVVKYYPEQGLSGFRVWKYLLRRDDPAPAPWEPHAKHYDIIYPDGFLEAQAEKQALQEKKSVKKGIKRKTNHSSDSEDDVQPLKKKKSTDDSKTSSKKTKRKTKSPTKAITPVKNSIASLLKKSPNKGKKESSLTEEEREAVKKDTMNAKLWEECLQICDDAGKKEFVEHVTQVFLCIICQDVTANPVTTPCSHNFCMACLKQSFKITESQCCPCCRNNLANYDMELNSALQAALRIILPGYDAGKK